MDKTIKSLTTRYEIHIWSNLGNHQVCKTKKKKNTGKAESSNMNYRGYVKHYLS